MRWALQIYQNALKQCILMVCYTTKRADIYISDSHTIFTKGFSNKYESSEDVKSTLFSCPFKYFTENLIKANYNVKIKLKYYSMNYYLRSGLFQKMTPFIYRLQWCQWWESHRTRTLGNIDLSSEVSLTYVIYHILLYCFGLNESSNQTDAFLNILFWSQLFSQYTDTGNIYVNAVIPTIVFLTEIVDTVLFHLLHIHGPYNQSKKKQYLGIYW